MKNDRHIKISTGSSRQATQWNTQSLTVSALYDRIKEPIRSSETLGMYLSLPKSKRDDLKDVGGFVGGELNGRRKAENLVGRDVITLDFDNVPNGGTDALIGKLDLLGWSYCVYSTRKHQPTAPRLRVLLPTNRTVGIDEYEPLARRAASLIGIEQADPTTFEATRLMYWPSVSSDGEYVYRAVDAPLLDADAQLKCYKDWHNTAEWPVVPGEDKAVRKLADKQADPRQKTDWVGAFCRTYDIKAAIEKYIPEAYRECDDYDDRLTYTNGSTTGGAVIYDDCFLYSHHATDPCCGKLVNAFDLIRTHLFGDMDDDVKAGTPTNRLPSYKAMLDKLQSDVELRGIHDREKGAEVFAKVNSVPTTDKATADELSAFIGGLEGEVYTTSITRQLLHLYGIQVRLNEITWQVEISGYPSEWSLANAENLLPVWLAEPLREVGMRGVTKQAVADSLDLIAEENRYNPVKDMLDETVWDGEDRTDELYRIIGVEDRLSLTLIRKWLWQCVTLALNDERYPVGADGVLVLQGAQGIGKTSVLRELVPIRRMFKEGARIDIQQKDTYIQALSSWICELGELDRTTVKDSAGLKAFITQELDNYRTPYARKAVQRPRRTSFCGTVNPESYLVDDTGNRRYWTVPVEHIDLKGLFALTDEWKAQMWAQMAVEILTKETVSIGGADVVVSFRATREEREALEKRNLQYAKPLDAEDEILELLDFERPVNEWCWVTAAAINRFLNNKFTSRVIGRALTKIVGMADKCEKRVRHGITEYWFPRPKLGNMELLTNSDRMEA